MGMQRLNGLISVLLIGLLTSGSLWADVRASLSRQAIQEGDSVTLSIMTSGDAGDGDPDLSVLQQDFDILGTGSSQQTNFINGKRSSSHEWQIELLPKHKGELQIPAISVGKQSTAALTLTVSALPAAATAAAGQPLFIETDIGRPDSPVYVQQQLRYTLKLYYREQLYEGSFDGPHADHALLEQLGKDKQYRTTVDGQQYQVLERRYAIFPEQSGTLTVSPVIFNGRLAGQSRQRMPSTQMSDMMERFFGNSMMSTPGKRVRLRGESITLDIQPRPDSYTGKYWLPSEQLRLTDSWADDPPEFSRGEPVTRTITLDAKGLESTHLPDLVLPGSDGMRLYPEKPAYENRTDGEWIFGRMQLSVAYVPTRTGMQTLPPITLDWWDTRSGQQRTAELPAWTINVLPGAGNTAARLPPAGDGTAASEQQSRDETAVEAPAPAPSLRWRYPAAGLAIGLGLFVGLLLWRRYRHRRADHDPDRSRLAQRAARAAVREACRDHNAARTSKALLHWATLKWPENPPRSLGGLTGRMPHMDAELQRLEQALYGQGNARWQGDALLQAFEQAAPKPAGPATGRRAGLSPLYPDWNT